VEQEPAIFCVCAGLALLSDKAGKLLDFASDKPGLLAKLSKLPLYKLPL